MQAGSIQEASIAGDTYLPLLEALVKSIVDGSILQRRLAAIYLSLQLRRMVAVPSMRRQGASNEAYLFLLGEVD